MGLLATTPQRWVAFLRAINVGGHTVKMSYLRELFAELGLLNVETMIASGNVSFEGAAADVVALEAQIERHLRQALGYEVATFLRTLPELAAIARYRPFADDEATLYIAFVSAPPSAAAQEKLMAFRSDIDDFDIHEREIYWLCRTKLSESRFSGALLEKAIGMPATLRNITTVKKLAAKYSPSLQNSLTS